MEIYIFVYLILLCSYFLKKKWSKWLFPILSFLLLFLGVFRAKTVGTDTGTWYYSNWVATTFNPDTWNKFTPMEPGYNIFMAFIKEYISNDYLASYGLTFAIAFGCTLYTIKKNSANPIFSLLIMYIFCIYTSYYNLMRQTLAMSICIIFIMEYLKKNIDVIRFFILVYAVSFLIHGTALLFCIIPFFCWLSKKEISPKILYVILAISLFLFINTSFINSVIMNTNTILSTRYFSYVEWGQQLDSNYSLLEMLMYMAFTTACIYYNKTEYFSPLFYLYFMGIVMRAAFINIVPIISRISDLTSIACIFFIPAMTENLSKKEKLIFSSIVLAIGSIIFFNALKHNYGEIIPYENILF